MKNKIFYDQDHASLYLQGSIIRVDSMPVWVERVERSHTTKSLMLQYRNLETIGKSAPKIRLSSSRVDMTPVPLGFLNFSDFGRPNVVVRAYRIPSRQWRIGLTTDNLRLYPHKFDYSEPKSKVIQSIYLKDSICGEFPSADEAIERTRTKVRSTAFSRTFAIERRKLKYIQVIEDVGEIHKGEIMLYDNYLYLSQLLEKAL